VGLPRSLAVFYATEVREPLLSAIGAELLYAAPSHSGAPIEA
jgi:hypothetical protein